MGVYKWGNTKQQRGEFEMNPGDTTALKDQSRSVSKREFRCQQERTYGCSYMALFPPVSEFSGMPVNSYT